MWEYLTSSCVFVRPKKCNLNNWWHNTLHAMTYSEFLDPYSTIWKVVKSVKSVFLTSVIFPPARVSNFCRIYEVPPSILQKRTKINELVYYSIHVCIYYISKGLCTSAGKHLGSSNQITPQCCFKKHFLILCITGLNLAFNFTALRQLRKKD